MLLRHIFRRFRISRKHDTAVEELEVDQPHDSPSKSQQSTITNLADRWNEWNREVYPGKSLPGTNHSHVSGPEESQRAPIIDLPCHWNSDGKLIPDAPSQPCTLCEWNGDPCYLLGGKVWHTLTGRDCKERPLKCVSCEIRRCILVGVARLQGRALTDTSYAYARGGAPDVILDDSGESRVWLSDVFTSDETPKSDIIRDAYVARRKVSTNPRLSDVSTQWARQRIAECTYSHGLACRPPEGSTFLPKRLINVQPEEESLDIRLEESHLVPPASSYLTLSYCWGNHRPACITTADSLHQNMARILWTGLPRTFRDAVAFTRSLGFKYLWIDSICIIQNDEEDWHREASKMYEVYKNSYLTLAALSGNDSTNGLRTISVAQSSDLFAELRIGHTKYPLYIQRGHYLDAPSPIYDTQGSYQDICHQYPLLDRAWTYQERLVSPRVLFFTESEMIYQCITSIKCECGAAKDFQAGTRLHPQKTEVFRQTRERQSQKESASNGNRTNTGIWTTERGATPPMPARYLATEDRSSNAAWVWRNRVLCDYPPLSLSMPRDRLPAIGAIANQFQRARQGERYLAGLWSGSLLEDLLWATSVKRSSESLPECKSELTRPFSLPTWSWASLQNEVEYPALYNTVDMATVIRADCNYAGGNAFGILESSKLILHGRLFACGLEWDGSLCHLRVQDWSAWPEYSTCEVFADNDGDGYQNVPAYQEVCLLPIMKNIGKDPTRSTWHLLLLRRKGEDGHVYERGGRVSFVGVKESHGHARNTGELPLDSGGLERAFRDQSLLTNCEIQ